jgi:hypothetical protein
MITIQHPAVYLKALLAKLEEAKAMEVFRKNISWILLLDGIRAYVGPRQIFHHEETPDGEDNAWGVLPEAEVLSLLTKENAMQMLETYFPANKYPKCVIGETTNIESFDKHNYGHSRFNVLRIHLLQDICLDDTLRVDLVDASERFDENQEILNELVERLGEEEAQKSFKENVGIGKFTLRHGDHSVITGAQLRKEVADFEMIGFLHLAGLIYKAHGILLNQAWFDENVRSALLESAYPEDLAKNTYRYMNIPAWVEEKMSRLDFSIEDMTCFGLSGDELLDVLDRMYSRAFQYTYDQI